MTAPAAHWSGLVAPPARVDPTCRRTGCAAPAGADGLCESHGLDQKRRRAALDFLGAVAGDLPAGYVEADPTWRLRAACRGLGPDLFFPETAVGIAQAKAVCLGCAVREPCLAYALATRQRFGVWGGTTERRRRPARERVSPGIGAA